MFFYICGQFTLKSQRRIITLFIKKAYRPYIVCPVSDQNKPWDPHVCCSTHIMDRRAWVNATRYATPFVFPVTWKEPKDNVSDWHFCLTLVSGHTHKTKHTICYPNLPLGLRPVLHSMGVSVHKRPVLEYLEYCEVMEWENSCEDEESMQSDSCLYLIMQPELNDIIYDLNLSKITAEVLASILQE